MKQIQMAILRQNVQFFLDAINEINEETEGSPNIEYVMTDDPADAFVNFDLLYYYDIHLYILGKKYQFNQITKYIKN